MNLVQPKRIGMVCRGEGRDVAVLKRLIECVDKRAEVILDRETAKKLKRQNQGMRIEDMSVRAHV